MIIIFILFLILFILFFRNNDNFENNYNFTVISNTCIGYLILQKYNIKYNNPFIGTLIINDYDYIKLSNNFMEYINYSPILYTPTDDKKNKYTEQTNNKYYIHDMVNIPYPIFKLKDIEIHCVHENNNDEALNKFNKRMNRLRELIKNDHKIFITMSFSQFLNKHDNYEILIDQFFKKSNNNIIKLFIGPPQYYKKIYGDNYMIIDEWINFNYERDEGNIFLSDDEDLCVDKIKELIDKFN